MKLTDEPYPRLSIVTQVRRDGATYLGPFPGRVPAQEAVDALHEALPLRRCLNRLSEHIPSPACALADMGRCGAPCDHRQSRADYAAVVAAAAATMAVDARAVVQTLTQRMGELAHGERYEEAGNIRDRLLALLRGAARMQRVAPLAASPEIVAARRAPFGGWEVICVRHGRLAGSMVTPRGADPMPHIEALRTGAEVVPAPPLPAPAATSEETELLLAWLERDDVRLVHLDGVWASPVHGACGHRRRFERLRATTSEQGPAGCRGAVEPASRVAT